MTSSRSIAAVVLYIGLAYVSAARADAARDACAALVDTRSALYSMMSAKDKSTQDSFKAKMQAASSKVDSAIAALAGANARTAADFRAIWDQFKATRDQEIIRAIYNGDTDNAKKLANGIQYNRLSKMWGIISCK